MEDTPPHRPKEPLPEEERDADDEDEDREDDEDECERTERSQPPDLTGDRADLGARQLDVGHDERHGRVSRRGDVRAKARRLAARTVRWTAPAAGRPR